MTNECRSYQDHEFCKSVDCEKLGRHPQFADRSDCTISGCVKTAKEFHRWLNNNGFFLLKTIDKEKGYSAYRSELVDKLDEYIEYLKPAVINDGMRNPVIAEVLERGNQLRAELSKLRKLAGLKEKG